MSESSLGDVSRDLERERYVGREQELERFRRNLVTIAQGDAHVTSVFAVSGDGGIGKSALVRRFEEAAHAAGYATAVSNEVEIDIVLVLARLVEQLEAQKRKCKSVSKALVTYLNKRFELQTADDAPEGFGSFVAKTLTRGGLAVAGQIPGIGIAASLVDADAIATHAASYQSYIARKVKNKDDRRLLSDPVATLSRYFADDLRNASRQGGVALFFDTFERTSEFLEWWLPLLLQGRYGALPRNLVVTVAGRNEIDQAAWDPLVPVTDRIVLKPFTDAEARHFLDIVGVDDHRVTETIVEKSNGLPLAVVSLAKGSPEASADVGDPSDTIVERLLMWITDPARRQLAEDATLPRQLNEDVLNVILGGEAVNGNSREAFGWLKTQPFFDQRGDGWVCHAVFRPQFLRVRRREAPASWTTLHGRLEEYFQEQRDAVNGHRGSGWARRRWRENAIEASYHRLCRDPEQSRGAVLNEFMSAFASDPAAARSYAEAIMQAGVDVDDADLEELGQVLIDGLNALPLYAEAAEEMWSAVLECEDLEPQWQAKALDWRGFIHSRNGNYEAALDDLGRAVDLDPTSAEYLFDRGLAHGAAGDAELALADLDLAHELDPDEDGILLVRASAYQMLEQYDEALRDVEAAEELDPLNLAAYALHGELLAFQGRLAEAVAVYDTAIAIDPEDAELFAARGRTRLGTGDIDEALEDFDAALAIKPNDYPIATLRLLALRQAGRPDEAMELAAELAQRAPAFVDELRESLRGVPKSLFLRRADLVAGLGGVELDLTAIEQVIYGDRDAAIRSVRAEGALTEAVALLAKGQLEEAFAAYDRATALAPDRVEYHVARAEALILFGRAPEAVVSLDEAAEAFPEDAAVLAARARAHVQTGDVQAALTDLVAATNLKPDNYGLWAMRLMLLQSLEDFDGAAAVARVLDEHAPALIAAAGRRSRVMPTGIAEAEMGAASNLKGTDPAAVRHLNELARHDEAAAVAFVRGEMARTIAVAHGEAGRLDEALEAVDRSLELDASQARTWFYRGELYRRKGDLANMLADLDQAVALAPHDADLLGMTVDMRLEGEDLEGARDDATRLIDADPSSALGYHLRSIAQGELGRFEEGLADADRAVDLEPELEPGHVTRAQLLNALGRGTEAIQALDRAIDLDPEDPAPRLQRGLLHLDLDHYDAALADLRRACELAPEHGPALVALAHAETEVGNYDAAIAVAERARDLDADEPLARYLLSAALQYAGRVAEALDEADAGARLAPDDAWVLFRQACAAGAAGDPQRSERLMAEVVTMAEDALAEAEPDMEPSALMEVGFFRLATGEHEQARSAYERALKHPAVTVAMLREARTDLRDFLRMWPGDAEATAMHEALAAALRDA
jgi:tetratricopeptide (TPR) repeat protein